MCNCDSALIEEQILWIEVEGVCVPYRINWTKEKKSPEGSLGPAEYVRKWQKANLMPAIDNVVLETIYSVRENTVIEL